MSDDNPIWGCCPKKLFPELYPERKPKMSNKNLSRNPQKVTPALWYYEEPKGLNIIHEIHYRNGTYFRTDQITIPWRKIFASVKRKTKREKK